MKDYRRTLLKRVIDQEKGMSWGKDALKASTSHELMQWTVHNARALFSCDVAILLSLIEENQYLQIAAFAGIEQERISSTVIPLGESLSGRLAMRGEPRLFKDLASHKRMLETNHEPYYRGSLISVPLVFNQQMIGLLNLCRYDSDDPFTFDDLNQLITFGAQTSFAIATQRLVDMRTEELKETLHALENNEQKFRSVVETASDGIITTDEKGIIILWNKAAQRIFGYPAEMMLGKEIGSVISRLFKKQLKTDMNQADTSSGSHVYETKMEMVGVRDDGSEFPLEFSFTKWKRNKGTFFTIIVRDITERKQIERTQALLSSVVEQLTESIIITDAQGKIVYVNPAFENMCGYSKEEAIGRIPQWLQGEDAGDTICKEMWSTVEKGSLWHGTMSNKRKDGSTFEADVTFLPVKDTEGNIVNYVAVIRDMSRERKMEEQLRQSQKMEAVGRLAGGIAHDFNNLLTVILGYTDSMIRDSYLDSKYRNKIEQISKAAKRASTLTRQLLAFSRKQMLQMKILDINAILIDMDKMFRRVIGEDIELVTMLDPDIGFVKADPGQLQQVIMNLVINSRDAMPNGGKLIITTSQMQYSNPELRSNATIPAGRYVKIEVTDTGTGMDDEVRRHIFEPFFTTKEIGKGTGLGLATVYGIIKQLGGFIFFDSQLGRGTTFEILLPLEKEKKTRLISTDKDHLLIGGNETVLVVEDEDMVREYVKTVLLTKGYKVLEAQYGAEALKLIRQYKEPIHLMLTDIVMPQMSGRELAGIVKEILPEIIILYMSGYSSDRFGELEDIIAGGHFLQKPFTEKELTDKVHNLLDRKKKLG